MRVTFTKRSICDCGFPVLKDEIQVGAQYDIMPDDIEEVSFTCGGCGKTKDIRAVLVLPNGGKAAGYLPEEIFTKPPTTTPRKDTDHDQY